MNAVFALDELFQDAHFRRKNAEMEALEGGAAQVLSATPLGTDTLSAFLDQMDQLEGQANEANSDAMSMFQKNYPADPARIHTNPKKKKMSSSLRTRRDKLALESTNVELQLEVKRILQERRENSVRIHERWKSIIEHELYKLKRVEAPRRRLNRMIGTKWGKSGRIAHLIYQLLEVRYIPSSTKCQSLSTSHIICSAARQSKSTEALNLSMLKTQRFSPHWSAT